MFRKSYITKNGAVKCSWTEEEVNILKQYYSEYGSKYCQKYMPHRKIQDISNKARRVGLSYRNQDRFKVKSILNGKRCSINDNEIQCAHCMKIFPATSANFYRRFHRNNQLSTICKGCNFIRNKKRLENKKAYLYTLTSNAIARKSGDLTPEDVYQMWEDQKGKCCLTGISLTHKAGRNKQCYQNASIDRIDNTQPYNKNNCRLVCKWANIARQILDDTEFINYCKLVVQNHQALQLQ